MAPQPGIVNLNDGELLEPRDHLSDRWRSLQIVRLDPGERRVFSSDDVEHAIYVLGGEGIADNASQQIGLETGIALTVPKGSGITVAAAGSVLELFHIALEVA
ncbi:MAG: hypothetical protein ACRDNK_25020 [Solirubrobacteraceae bacterium]